jgi:intracellular multiplication protein IcmX
MATRRLFNTDPSQPSQWLTQINSSSPATVQKEMVALLAEINFQLYLNRQQEERLLLTNSMLLLRLGKQMEPSLELPTAEDN